MEVSHTIGNRPVELTSATEAIKGLLLSIIIMHDRVSVTVEYFTATSINTLTSSTDISFTSKLQED
jgi:hypothetical protein